MYNKKMLYPEVKRDAYTEFEAIEDYFNLIYDEENNKRSLDKKLKNEKIN